MACPSATQTVRIVSALLNTLAIEAGIDVDNIYLYCVLLLCMPKAFDLTAYKM